MMMTTFNSNTCLLVKIFEYVLCTSFQSRQANDGMLETFFKFVTMSISFDTNYS